VKAERQLTFATAAAITVVLLAVLVVMIAGRSDNHRERVLVLSASAPDGAFPAGWPGQDAMNRAKNLIPVPLPAPLADAPSVCDRPPVTLSVSTSAGEDEIYGPCQAPAALERALAVLISPGSINP
jgi:hypothetical protein